MSNFVSNVNDSLRLLLSMSLSDVLDVLVVAVAVYGVISFIRRTNSIKVAQGILLLLVALGLASILKLSLTSFLLRQIFEIGVIAMVILFQPEIRRALERVGSYKFFSLFGRQVGGQSLERTITKTVYACESMARERVGALIVFERVNHLAGIVMDPGTEIDALVSTELLRNIFYKGSPLHDGAVIIREGRIAAAGCMLPLTEKPNLSRDLGTRHRAGLGMSERSDAVVVIVSEETGSISVAVDGLLKRHLSGDVLEEQLRRELLPAEDGGAGRGALERLKKMFSGKKPEKVSKDAEQNRDQ